MSRLFFATIVFAGLVLPVFSGHTEEAIQLIPPQSLSSDAEVLSPSDKELYSQIFSNLDNGDLSEAETLLKTADNDILKGYVLAQIYLAENAQPTKKQLGDWLKKYADLPIAESVYDLAAEKKAPLPAKKPSDPAAHITAGVCTSTRISDPIDLVFFKRAFYVPEEYKKDVRKAMSYFSSAIRNGKTLAAKLHLNDRLVKKYLSQKDRDDSLTALAFAYFIDRQDQKAWETIQEPLKRAESRNPTAYWVAGLTAFRLQKWEEAEKAFKTLTAHP